MGIYADSWFTELIAALSLLFIFIYGYFSYSYKYWKKRGVPFLEPTFPWGNMRSVVLGEQSPGLHSADVYTQLKRSGHRFGGIYFFSRPSFTFVDPELIRHVLVKDFSSFQDRGVTVDPKEPLTKHLLLLNGNKWRRLRVKLTPTFTSGKLKMMFQTMADCGREMAEVLEGPASRREVLEMREIMARYSTDIIASVAFGIEVHCQRDPENSFRQLGRQLFKPTLRTAITGVLRLIHPALLSLPGVRAISPAVSQYFRKIVTETMKYREENNVTRKDFMQLLIQLKNKGSVDSDKGEAVQGHDMENSWKLSEDDAAAQAFVFFIAGFETTSSTISFALHELAHNPDIQKKLREEIDAVVVESDKGVTYDEINSMQYLSKVVSETLRKYPPLMALNRVTVTEYKIPDTDVVLEKDTPIIIPVYGLHKDPEIYPDPERFDPERFTEAEKIKRHPMVYLPFGDGPRNCIGMRLGLVQSKVALVHLLSKFNVEPVENSSYQIEFSPRLFLTNPTSGINLLLTKRK